MLARIFLFTLLLASAASALAAQQPADAAAGVWQTKSGGYVQFYKADAGDWSGRIVGSVSGKPRYDDDNPDASERGRRLLGVTVLRGLKYAGNGEYEGGKIYDPDNGKTYSAKATLKSTDELDVRGYIGVSLIGKSQRWKRISADAAHVHQDLLHEPVGPR